MTNEKNDLMGREFRHFTGSHCRLEGFAAVGELNHHAPATKSASADCHVGVL